MKSEAKEIFSSKRRAFDQWKIASPWRRLWAQLIDHALIISVTGFVLSFMFPEKAYTKHWWGTWVLFWPFVYISTQCIFLSRYGTSPGKKLAGLRVQSARHGHYLTAWQVIQRVAGWWLGVVSLGISWSTVLSRTDRRSWHDIVAETVVVQEANEASHSNRFEKNMGHTWAVVVSLSVITILTTLLIVQIRKLQDIADLDRQPKLLIKDKKDVETFSWFLLDSELPKVNMKNADTDSEHMIHMLTHFSKARLLQPSKRFEYYKDNMQSHEDSLCRPGQTLSQECQSAQFMASLLTNKTYERDVRATLPVLQVLKYIEEVSSIEDEILYLNKRASKALLSSAEYLATKTALAKISTQKGDFNKALNTVKQDIQHIESQKLDSNTQILFNYLHSAGCEADALVNCQTNMLNTCVRLDHWKDWSQGCKLEVFPTAFLSPTEALGFWWGKVSDEKNKGQLKLENWNKTKRQFESQTQTAFEKNLFEALDFVVSIYSTDPQQLVDRARKMNTENPFWGWAQSKAVKEYGSQWKALMKKTETQKYVFLNSRPKSINKQERVIASEPKKSKKKKRIKN